MKIDLSNFSSDDLKKIREIEIQAMFDRYISNFKSSKFVKCDSAEQFINEVRKLKGLGIESGFIGISKTTNEALFEKYTISYKNEKKEVESIYGYKVFVIDMKLNDFDFFFYDAGDYQKLCADDLAESMGYTIKYGNTALDEPIIEYIKRNDYYENYPCKDSDISVGILVYEKTIIVEDTDCIDTNCIPIDFKILNVLNKKCRELWVD